MADNYIPQVDYTSRDFAAIRQDLIDLIPFYAPLWTNRDPADFGMVLIEAFAYVGDLLITTLTVLLMKLLLEQQVKEPAF